MGKSPRFALLREASPSNLAPAAPVWKRGLRGGVLRCLLILTAALALVGCEGLPFGTATSAVPPLSATPPADTPQPPTATATASFTEIPSAEPLVLTVWLPEALAPRAETAGGQALIDQIAAFEERHPDIRVELYTKLTSGPGSTLAYLHSAPAVAPSILPDLTLLDRPALTQAARDNLIVPLEGLVDPALLSDLYPVALELGTVGEQMVGLPYVLQVAHVVYRETLFQEPPNSFEAVLRSPVPYVFPAGTLGNVNETLLLQYLAAGGRLADETGAPFVDPVVLTEVLRFYAQAHAVGIVDTALFQLTDMTQSWEQYVSRQAGLAAVTSTAYLNGRANVRNTGITWTPTLSGEPYALASGWMWVMVTREPDRQAAAIALVNELMNPVNHGTYTQAAGWLPSQVSALAVWGDSDPYVAFGDRLLRSAVVPPEASLRASAGAALQDALEAVLLSGTLPFEAAAEAARKVNTP